MKNIECSVLIAEDEEIERESLKSILRNHYNNSIKILTAKNGREAVSIYQEELPDIVLMDINMPKLNGLEAIEKMKKIGHQSTYLVLTSYDYFNYARDAIRLGVEDFLLKPARPDEIIKAISHAQSNLKISRNKDTSTSELIRKYYEIQPMLEQECLQSILSGQNELTIQTNLRRLNLSVKTGVCMVVLAPAQDTLEMKQLQQDIKDVGYGCLYGYFQQHHVFFILHNVTLLPQDMEVLEYIIAQHHLKRYSIGIGTIQKELSKFNHSYTQAMRTIRLYDQGEPLCFPISASLIQPVDWNNESYVKQLTQAFQNMDEVLMNQTIQKLAQELMPYAMEQIKVWIDTLVNDVVEQLQTLVEVTIDVSSLPKFYVKEAEKYQNLEISLHYLFHALFQPLRKERYQESSTLAKQAMQYIEQNFRKPISLNDLAKHLHVTPFYISKLIKSSFDHNFTDIVAEVRIEEAKRLLKEHRRVKEVAFDVGFQSQSYFAKMFKKLVGVTPTEYQDFFI